MFVWEIECGYVCAGEGLPRLHYAWGRLHAVIVCVWCGSMRAHCCAVRPNREWGGCLGVGAQALS